MSQPVYIYGLFDPRDSQCRYVGKTTCLKTRLTAHLFEATPPAKAEWIRELAKLGLKPVMRSLHEATNENWQDAEREAIAHYRRLGCNLLNVQRGGGAHSIHLRSAMVMVNLSIPSELRHFYENIAVRDERSLSYVLRIALQDQARQLAEAEAA